MNSKFLLITFLLFSGIVNAQTAYRKLISKAQDFYEVKDYKKSGETYAEAFKLESKNKSDLYNGACSAALAGDIKNAILWLNLSVDNGWDNYAHLNSDTDLKGLHNTKEWEALMIKIRKSEERLAANYNQPLKKELESIFKQIKVLEMHTSRQRKHMDINIQRSTVW